MVPGPDDRARSARRRDRRAASGQHRWQRRQRQPARGAGVLVTLGGLFFATRDVTKAASFELGAFEAPPFGPLGRVDADASVV
ncbi:MAG: L-asparaginase (EC [Candidatus Burkholderia crenata]|nr:MAG: L-asparaginase (EC [Candidatus Burkholderia crenata]